METYSGSGWTSFANVTGNVILTGSLTSINTFDFKNRLINGGMTVSQRATGATVVAGNTVPTISTGYYTVDRWFMYSLGANVTANTVSGTGTVLNNTQITGAASVTAVGVGQRIEQKNSIDLAGSTCTLSVNMSNSLLTTVTWTASYANTADAFGNIASPTKTQIATGTWTVNSTLSQYTAQIAVPSAATTGIEILFTVGAQTSGTWVIGQAQFEKGAQTTSFDYRDIGRETILCQRYFQSFITPMLRGVSGGTTSLNRLGMPLPVMMRANPTPAVSGSIPWYDGTATGTFTAVLVNYSNTTNAEIDATAATGTTVQSRPIVTYQGSGVLTLSAEVA
jgi:hypothetical protein